MIDLKDFSSETSDTLIKEYIDLAQIGGFEFEDFCARLCKRIGLGNVEMTTRLGDKGKDYSVGYEQVIYYLKEMMKKCTMDLKIRKAKTFILGLTI